MNKSDLYWVAGLLEGEGCFTIKSRKAGTLRDIVILCQMTDEDVLKKLFRLTGVGRLNGPYTNGPRGKRPRWTWAVSGRPAYKLMKSLMPLMGKRRRARICELIRRYESVGYPVYRILNVRSGKVHEIPYQKLTDWMSARNLKRSSLHHTYAGKRTHYKGWRRLKTKNSFNFGRKGKKGLQVKV